MTNSNDAILGTLDITAAEKAETFAKDDAQCIAALHSTFGHLAWVLTAKPIPKQRRYITAAAYASRVMQHAYGAYRLVRIGNNVSAEVVLRAALEAAFAVGALANDENFAGTEDYYLRLLFKSTLGKKKALEAFLETADTLSSEQHEKGQDQLAALQADLDKLKAFQLSRTSAIAKAAKMEDFYVREYASQSRIFHSDLEMVVNEHVASEEGEIRVRAVLLSLGDARILVAHLVAVMMETATAMSRLLQVDLSDTEITRIAEINDFYGQALLAASS